MKKILYSPFTKAAAILLICFSVIYGSVLGARFVQSVEDPDFMYDFQDSMSNSSYVGALLERPLHAVYTAYAYYYEGSDASKDNGEEFSLPSGYMESHLPKVKNDQVWYYIKINDEVYSNNTALDPEAITAEENYSYGTLAPDSEVTYDSSGNHAVNGMGYLNDISEMFHSRDTITVGAVLTPEYAHTLQTLWQKQASQTQNILITLGILAVLTLISLVYLLIACGHRKNGELMCYRGDHLWPELRLIAFFSVGLIALAFAMNVITTWQISDMPEYAFVGLVDLATILGGLICLGILLSLVRSIKMGFFLKDSLILRLLRWAWNLWKKLWQRCKAGFGEVKLLLAKKSGWIWGAALLGYTIVIGLCGICLGGYGSVFFLLVAFLSFGAAVFLLSRKARELDELRKGAAAIRKGDLGYRLPELRCAEYQKLGEDLQAIGEGLQNSVSEKLKAERMKTELITNVSHDLKTPLTSMINYVQLLSDLELSPEEAVDYVKILEKKSQRLKTLTSDLFDIAKVQSGNEDIAMEPIDISLVVQQSLGEHDAEIQKAELPFCVQIEKELCVRTDGRKMSRVVGNLIENALKYAMVHTRVFVTVAARDDQVMLEFKNISAYPLDFDPEEITDRFVRGDQSRSEEGNGLGLAIAKSYTEACGGTFRLSVDGDLFKVVILFPAYQGK